MDGIVDFFSKWWPVVASGAGALALVKFFESKGGVVKVGVVKVAESQWGQTIKDESPWYGRIDRYIRGEKGLAWPGANISDLGAPEPYDGNFKWCGAFVAWCWGTAGLSKGIRFKHLASTYRLKKWASQEPDIRVPVDQIRPGDICSIGAPDQKNYGTHMVLVVGLGDGVIYTIEGNAIGEGPGGDRYEGVVRQVRHILQTGNSMFVRVAVRPQARHFS